MSCEPLNWKVINCTPHEVNFYNGEGEQTFSIAPSGILPRVEVTHKIAGYLLNGDIEIPYYKVCYGELNDLPPAEEGTVLIVSLMVKQAAHNRRDLFVPFDTVRNDTGQIIGCKGLA